MNASALDNFLSDDFIQKTPQGLSIALVFFFAFGCAFAAIYVYKPAANLAVTAVAVRLSVPVVAMAEDISQMGSVTPSIAEKFPPDMPVFNKMIFGLAADNEIMAAVKDTG